jgi:hypothetical protein
MNNSELALALMTLATVRVYVVAAADQYGENGKKTFSVSNSAKAQDQRVKLIPSGEMLYFPQYQRDWEKHPHALRTIDVATVRVRSSIDASVEMVPSRSIVFLIPPSWKEPLISGKASEKDILNHLSTTSGQVTKTAEVKKYRRR